MSLRDLSLLVDYLARDVDKLDQVSSAKVDGSSEDALNVFRQTIKRNMVTSNLEYARKLLLQLDQATVVGSTGDLSGLGGGSARAALQSERRRIRAIHDNLQAIDKTLTQRTESLKAALQARQRDDLHASPLPAPDAVAETDMLSTPSPPSPVLSAEPASAVPSGVSTTLESRLEYHRQQQADIAASLLAQTQRLKQNAQALGAKLDADKDVVRNAIDALDRNVTNMKTTGGRLAQYRNISAIGWRFYIVSVLVMFVSVLIGLIVVKLLPKW